MTTSRFELIRPYLFSMIPGSPRDYVSVQKARFPAARRVFPASFGALAIRLLALTLTTLLLAGCGKNAEQLLASAKQAHAAGNHRAAIIELKHLLEEIPEHAEARYLLGICQADIGDFVTAEKELERALVLHQDRPRVLLALARSHLEQGNFQKVLSQIGLEAATNDRERAEFLAVRGLASLGVGQLDDARRYFEEALAKQPENTLAVVGTARLAAHEKKWDEAQRLIDRALAAAPRDIEAWILKGDLLRESRQTGADAAYQKALAINPEYVPALLRLIRTHVNEKNFEEAERLLGRVNEVAPRSLMVQYTKAYIQFRKGNYEGAHEEALRILKAKPDHVPSLMLAGEAAYALGAFGQAQSHLRRVVERDPRNAYARKLFIMSLAKNGDTQRALETAESELKKTPRDASLLVLAGDVALQAGDFTKATVYFEKAARLDQSSAGARTGLAASRLGSGDMDRALADLEEAARLDPENLAAELLLVATHLKRDEFDKALDALQRLEQKEPKDARIQSLKAAAYLKKKDTAAARTHLEQALQLQPTDVAAALQLARLDLQAGNPPAARRRIEAVLNKDPSNIQALLALAELGQRIGATWEEQIQWLEKAHQASPATVQTQILLARLYSRTGQPMKALEIAQRAHSTNPGNAEALHALGSLQVAQGEKKGALTTYTKLAQLQPESPATLFSLANAQYMNGDMAGAAVTLRKVLQLKPDYPEALLAMTDVEIRAGRYAEATKIARQIQKRDPKSPVGLALEGDVLFAERKYDQAAKLYEMAYAVRKSGPLAIKLHTAYLHANRPAEAAERLAQWLKTSPDDRVTRLYLADTAMKAGNYKSAIEQYEWVRRREPDNVAVLNNLAWSYQQTGNPLALEAAESAYKLKPDDPEVADTLGWILTERGNTSRAVEVLRKAAAIAPTNHTIRYHLAQAWLKAGEKQKARQELESLLSTNLKFPEQAEALKLLDQIKLGAL